MQKIAIALISAGLLLGACSEDDTTENPVTGEGQFILAVSPVASTGVADYLLTAENLETGTISTAGNGIEQDGTFRYYVTHNNRFFSMLYGQGNPGAVTAYELNRLGRLEKVTNFQTETVQAFAPVNDDILLIKVPRSGGEEALWYRVDSEQLLIADEGQTNIVKLAGNGERAHFTWITQVGDKVFAPYMSIKGCCGDTFGTSYPDSAWVAVYSYPDMQLETVIKDDRTSYIGRYFENGLALVENGDVYAFSSSVATNGEDLTSTKPSAITRISAGTTEFDQSYYFNIEEASGGSNITSWTYVGNGNVIALLTSPAEKGGYVQGKRLAAINLQNKTFKWISGMPEVSEIESVTSNNYTPKDGKTAYIGLTLTDGISYVYKADAIAGTATQGLKVEGGTLTAISRLENN
ncbi:uncharacterized protein DUF4374 [Anseongella ginsenosidimutans]|uniref:Uncharacterized protein DUF4374 n=2 Tax=Anseongella ginsenosidimutans TaxID=496056 RepID=A0A4R3L009_9SPHI|nr:uncharacterized protein DUF4374 [Anseongella ginsenosidimutans]